MGETLTTSPADILERNLRALARTSPRAASLVEQARARADVVFTTAEDGALTAQVGTGAAARALASRRRPLDEALRFVDTIDLKSAAVYVVAGFGVGHHVRELARRVGRTGLVVVFEPDAGLLRSVMERVDCSDLFGGGVVNVAVLTDPDDTAAMAGVVQGLEGVVALGVQLVEHPPSKPRLDAMGDVVERFHQRFITLVKGVKLTIVTTLVQIKTTLRNLTQNLDHYILRPGIDELRGSFTGRPAIVVSAGPSLARNVNLLSRPGVRDRFVIIAVQTVLKTLLEKGIRPHFVTALDYSDISARFYEGLTERDVEGVTLVVEPKVNPAVLAAFPGDIRCVGDRYLDQLLTPALSPARAPLTPGATVAHLAYYLARYMGCDPVALVGQDLAFTDGQYYSAGAAIHRTWAGELNEFQTLESLEWQRIARMGQHLHRATDIFDRPVFTDEQMSSYRLQFERDFMVDVQRGLGVVDCTEGGVKKLYTVAEPLGAFLSRFDGIAAPIRVPSARMGTEARGHLQRVERHLRDVRAKVWRVGEHSRRAADLLDQMRAKLGDQARVNRLIEQTHELRKQVEGLEPGYGMVHLLNQSGALNRLRADRLLQLEPGLSDSERQARQVERDSENVRSLARSADELGELLDHALAALPASAGGGGRAKLTRDPSPPGGAQGRAESGLAAADQERNNVGTSRVCAVVPLIESTEAGWERLRLTIARLARIASLDAIAILNKSTPTDSLAHPVPALIVKEPLNGKRIEIIDIGSAASEADRLAVAAARAFARDCWRSAPGSLTCYDEVFFPRETLAALERTGCDAALIVGADWCLIDPALCGQVIERQRTRPAEYRLVFTQAPPGLCGAVLHRSLVADVLSLRSGRATAACMAVEAGQTAAGKFASIGGMLAYVPVAPTTDLIAYPVCVTIDPEIRDAGDRFVVDGPASITARVVERLGDRALSADAAAAVRAAAAIRREGLAGERGEFTHLVLQVAEVIDDRVGFAPADRVLSMIEKELFGRPGLALTLVGSRLRRLDFRADPLDHPEIMTFIRAARSERGAFSPGLGGADRRSAVHVRTRLLCEPEVIDEVLDAGVDVISVDLLAESAGVYGAVTGRSGHGAIVAGADEFSHARQNMEHLLAQKRERSGAAWLSKPLVVARMTRCDAAYADVESFYNRWMTRADWAVLDPLPSEREGERIAPLPIPPAAAERFARATRVVTFAELCAEPGASGGRLEIDVPRRVADGPAVNLRGPLVAGTVTDSPRSAAALSPRAS